MKINERFLLLQDWIHRCFGNKAVEWLPLAGDASFRRYFRIKLPARSFVVMDAPPEKESCQPFVSIAAAFRQLGLKTPEIHEMDLQNGFLLLSDFGDRLYLNELNKKTAPSLYQTAFDALFKILTCQGIGNYSLPLFDAFLYQQEMGLFKDWFLEKQLGIFLNSEQESNLNEIFSILIKEALSQPQVCVHRDYHSRNLMVLENAEVGILDFQDAVWGPITYDLLSLLRDCYIDWPSSQVESWVFSFHQQALRLKLLEMDDPKLFLRWFDWVCLQRNLKCIGLFSRLNLRDHKPNYLQYTPRVINYARAICEKYKEFTALNEILIGL